MRTDFLMILIFFVTPLVVSGCGKSQPPAAQLAASAEAQAEGPLPELEQNKVNPFNLVTPEDPSRVQVFENHDDEHQQISEEEKHLLFPPATD